MTAAWALLAGMTAAGLAFGAAVHHFTRVDHALDDCSEDDT